MHCTLEIPEILYLIFAQVQRLYCYDERLGRRDPDLAALARTCKTFRGPALDFLWREQENLVNVLRLLPSHVCREREGQPLLGELPDRILQITGPICPAD
ncbi:hypothetical protein K438DRAFT_1892945 [Mycena galopus ATCC 62051]|nr:hypothetical protein K438DRAFT_1892945 [Mycena galopus ATCC 62051]